MPRRPVYPLGKGDIWMATIIECSESIYEAKQMPYVKAYASYPRCVVMEYGEWRKSGGASRLASLPNPPPGRLLAEDELSPLTNRDRFVEFLIAH
jgi:hypothetical protein